MTADGAHLYVSSRGGSDVVRFARSAGTGALSDPQPLGAVTLPAAALRRRILRLGTRAFDVPEGARATIRLRLSKRSFAILTQRRRLVLRVSVRATDAAGNVRRAARRVTLLAPAPRR